MILKDHVKSLARKLLEAKSRGERCEFWRRKSVGF